MFIGESLLAERAEGDAPPLDASYIISCYTHIHIHIHTNVITNKHIYIYIYTYRLAPWSRRARAARSGRCGPSVFIIS